MTSVTIVSDEELDKPASSVKASKSVGDLSENMSPLVHPSIILLRNPVPSLEPRHQSDESISLSSSNVDELSEHLQSSECVDLSISKEDVSIEDAVEKSLNKHSQLLHGSPHNGQTLLSHHDFESPLVAQLVSMFLVKWLCERGSSGPIGLRVNDLCIKRRFVLDCL